MMNAAEKLELDVLLNKAGGENTSEINSRVTKIISIASQLPDSIHKQSILTHAVVLDRHNNTVGKTLEEMQQWANAHVEGGGAPPTNPTSFATRAAFDAWARTSQNAVTLDGVEVHSGFGPPSTWFTQPDGTISGLQPGTAPDPGPGTPPPAPGGDWRPLKVFEQPPRSMRGDPHIPFELEMGDPGSFTVEISGSPSGRCWVGRKGDEATSTRKSNIQGTSFPLDVSAGEFVSWIYDAPQGGQNMRPGLRPNR